MKNTQIIIKKDEWNKILGLVSKVYDRADQLYNSFAGVDKIYKELGRYAEQLKGKTYEINEQKQEIKSKLTEVYTKGFHNGVNFVDGELGDCISFI